MWSRYSAPADPPTHPSPSPFSSWPPFFRKVPAKFLPGGSVAGWQLCALGIKNSNFLLLKSGRILSPKIWVSGSATQGRKFQIKYPCVIIPFRCVPVTNHDRICRAVGRDAVILAWLLTVGPVVWEGVGERQETDREVRQAKLLQNPEAREGASEDLSGQRVLVQVQVG